MLRAAILFWGATSVINAPLVTALAVHITRDLRETASVLGVVLAAYGIGTVTGALVISRRGGRRPVSPMLFGGNVLFGTSLLLVSTVASIPVLALVAVAAGIAQSMVLVTYVTLRAAYSPDELLGRIGSTARTISLGLQPVGLLVGGALIDLTSGSTTIALMGIAILLVCVVFAPVGALRRATLQPALRPS